MLVRTFYDNMGNLWIEYPADSGQFLDLNYAAPRVAEKFGSATLAGIAADGYTPLTELIPKVDYSGWAHAEGCAICPDCNAWIPIEKDDTIEYLLELIQNHMCNPQKKAAWDEARRRFQDES